MKIFKIIFKILTILILIFINIISISYNVQYSGKYLRALTAAQNLNNFRYSNDLHINQGNKMTLIYFTDNKNTEKYKFDTLKNFIVETDCNEVVNFIDFQINEEDTDNLVIASSILNSDIEPNSVVLLNKTGYKIASFSPNVSVVDIENELKEILKNYL